jgi:hypothetical protein
MNTSPAERFTERVENYVKYRSGYPHALLDCLREQYGLTAVFPSSTRPNSILAN